MNEFYRLLFIPEIFIPLVSFLIVIFSISLYVIGRKKETAILKNKGSQEADIYSRVYGENQQEVKSSIPKTEPLPVREPQNLSENLPGETYDSAFLLVKQGQNPGEKFNLEQKETTIGSGEGNSIVLWDKTVDQRHVKIKNMEQKFVIFDLISRKGVFLNEKKLLRPRVLFDFDEIRLGRTTLIFRGK